MRLCIDTAAVAEAWSRASALDDAALIAASPEVLELLGTLNGTSSAAMRAAVANKVQVAKALADVDRAIQDNERRQPGLKTQLTDAQHRLESARADLQNAQNELDGGKGFLNGFLTAITFSLYNPLKDNLDRANNAVAEINRQIASIDSQAQLIASAQRELEQKRQLVDLIGRMDRTVTDFQNAVNQAQDPLSRARENFEKFGRSSALVKVYVGHARRAMADLSGWVPTFNSVVRQLALENRTPSTDCAKAITGCRVTWIVTSPRRREA